MSKEPSADGVVGWQPIETAPKDGTAILLHYDWEPLTVVGYFGTGDMPEMQHDRWRVKYDCDSLEAGFGVPTHWMPLPPAPRRSHQTLK